MSAYRPATIEEHAKAATRAHTDLTVFHSIIAILEGGCIYGSVANRDANKLIRACKSAAVKQLAIMDKHMDKVREASDVG